MVRGAVARWLTTGWRLVLPNAILVAPSTGGRGHFLIPLAACAIGAVYPVVAPAQRSATGYELYGVLGVGGLPGAGPLGALGAEGAWQRGRLELRVGAERLGGLTGCMGFCDLRDATAITVGAGTLRPVAGGAWSAGALVGRVSERFDTPRPMAAAYLRRAWMPNRHLRVALEARLFGMEVRGRGVRTGWSARAGVGVGRRARGER